jgi:hypothetical protein
VPNLEKPVVGSRFCSCSQFHHQYRFIKVFHKSRFL